MIIGSVPYLSNQTQRQEPAGDHSMRNATFLIATAMLGSALVVSAQSESGGGAPIDATVRAIGAGSLAAIEVLRIPDDTESRVNINPGRLESWWDYKFTIRGRGLTLRAQELTTALRTATVQPFGRELDSLDVRWAILFYSKTPEGKRIASLYFDKTGRHGGVNNISTSFGPDFFSRLKKALHISLE